MKQETIARIRRFSTDRDWEQFHTPANLAKSISIEANELLECFQWSDTDYDRAHVGEELADVMVYCQNRAKGIKHLPPVSVPFRRFLPFFLCWASARLHQKEQKSLEKCQLTGASQF